MVEGAPAAGKSVLCQHITSEALQAGYGVVYYTSEHTPRGLIAQMDSLGMDVSDHFRAGRLVVQDLEEPTGSGPGSCDDPAQVMVLLAHEIEILASMYKVVIVDDLAGLAGKVPEVATIGFFASCRRLCDSNRRTIVLAAHSYVFDEKLLCRLRVACNAHLSLRTEKIGAKMVKLVEVKKAHDGEQNSGNTVSFEVAAGVGMRTVPGVKIKL